MVGVLLLGVGIRLPLLCAPTAFPAVRVGVVGLVCLGDVFAAGGFVAVASVDVVACRGEVLTDVGLAELGVVGRTEVVRDELGVVGRAAGLVELGVVDRG